MAIGFDDAAAVAGLIQLGSLLFQACITGFFTLRTAQHLGNEADSIRCMLEFEEYRLLEWGDKAGLESSGHANPEWNWSLINKVLDQISRLLNDTSELKERYQLDLTVAEDRNEIPPDFSSEESNGLKGITRSLRPKFSLETSRIIHSKNSIWKRMR